MCCNFVVAMAPFNNGIGLRDDAIYRKIPVFNLTERWEFISKI